MQDEVEPQSNSGTCAESSLGCTTSGDRFSSPRSISQQTRVPVRERFGLEPDQYIQDGTSYEVKEGTPGSPPGVEWSKLESRAFKRPPPARSQKKKAKGEPPTTDVETSTPKLASAPRTRSPIPLKINELNLVSSPSHPRTDYKNAGTLTGETSAIGITHWRSLEFLSFYISMLISEQILNV